MCFDIVCMCMCFHVALGVYIVGVLGRWVCAVCRSLVCVCIVCGVWGFFLFCILCGGCRAVVYYVVCKFCMVYMIEFVCVWCCSVRVARFERVRVLFYYLVKMDVT